MPTKITQEYRTKCKVKICTNLKCWGDLKIIYTGIDVARKTLFNASLFRKGHEFFACRKQSIYQNINNISIPILGTNIRFK